MAAAGAYLVSKGTKLLAEVAPGVPRYLTTAAYEMIVWKDVHN